MLHVLSKGTKDIAYPHRSPTQLGLKRIMKRMVLVPTTRERQSTPMLLRSSATSAIIRHIKILVYAPATKRLNLLNTSIWSSVVNAIRRGDEELPRPLALVAIVCRLATSSRNSVLIVQSQLVNALTMTRQIRIVISQRNCVVSAMKEGGKRKGQIVLFRLWRH